MYLRLKSMLRYCSIVVVFYFFFFKQKTAYEMRISDWSSDVCSSDLDAVLDHPAAGGELRAELDGADAWRRDLRAEDPEHEDGRRRRLHRAGAAAGGGRHPPRREAARGDGAGGRRPQRRRDRRPLHRAEIGRASCRERVCQYV